MTEMRRCDRCRHWKRDAEHHVLPPAVARECGAIRHENTATQEAKRLRDDDAYQEAIAAVMETEQALAYDAEEFEAYLITAPSFFCAKVDPLDELGELQVAGKDIRDVLERIEREIAMEDEFGGDGQTIRELRQTEVVLRRLAREAGYQQL